MGIPPPIQLDTISMPDTLVLMVLALVVFGPRRLPKIGRQIGKLMYEFRKASNDFKFQMEEELRNAEEADRRKKEEEERQRALAAAPQLAQSTSPTVETPPPAPEPEASALVSSERPYPDETGYSDSASESVYDSRTGEIPTPAPEISQPAEPSPQSEAVTPRIQPPSSGETIAARRPGAQPEQQELFAPSPGDSGKPPDQMTPEIERSEPAAHHG